MTSYRLLGGPGSPYSLKMRAVLRYRRIPYRLLLASHRAPPEGMPRSKVPLLPTFYFPGANGELEAVTDSTPIIRRLENEFQGRSIIPSDPVIAFLDYLLEDYGDEWLTKAMFHYRWYYKADIENAGNVLPIWAGWPIKDDELADEADHVVSVERSDSPVAIVGGADSNPRAERDDDGQAELGKRDAGADVRPGGVSGGAVARVPRHEPGPDVGDPEEEKDAVGADEPAVD